MGLDVLHNNNRRGVIRYKPLLKTVDFKTIPICLEKNPTDFRLLDKVAKVISDKSICD
jgi:hypothetical protein